MTLLILCLLLLASAASLYYRLRLWQWALIVGGILLAWWLLDTARVAQSIITLLVLAGSIPVLVTPLRQKLFSAPVLAIFKKALPDMSSTEREALEAGSVWWDGELFSGKPDWRKLLQAAPAKLTDEEQAFLEGPVKTLCAMLDDWQITHEQQDLPSFVWDYIKQQGFFGMIIPKRYGGLGFSAYAHSCVVLTVASRSVSAGVTVMVPNSLGPAELLLRYGTDEQKEHYLPRLAKGIEVPCFALTGPEAGSDASAIPDTGIVCRASFEGKPDVLGIRLNWDKRYITLGPVATVLGLAFKLYDPDHLLGDKRDYGITLALIPTDTPGVTIGRRHYPLNAVFQNGPNQGKDVFIPMDWIIGGQERLGQGWRMLMECLAAGRGISLPALSTGAGKLASRAIGAYARIRRQFKTPIGKFEGVEEALARIAGLTYQMDAVRTVTAAALDEGHKPSVISAIAKYHLTESMRCVINDAMDIQGGAAICLGPRNIMGRAYQSVPISITVEGANILTRSLIIFGQGAVRCHPYVLREMQAVKQTDPQRRLHDFDRALFGHIGFTLSNLVRSLWLGLTGARLTRSPGTGEVKRYYQHLSRMSAAFALVSDMSMLLLGGQLKRKEKLSGRLADVLSHLFLASAVLKHHSDQGSPKADLPLVKWTCDRSLFCIQQSLGGLLRNYPNQALAYVLRWIIFPFGRTFSTPQDQLGHKLAQLLLAPSEVRDRLTAGLYIGEDKSEQLALIEDALTKVIAAEAVERKIRQAQRSGDFTPDSLQDLATQARAQNIINAEEYAILTQADKARRSVIAVDDFDAQLDSSKPATARESSIVEALGDRQHSGKEVS